MLQVSKAQGADSRLVVIVFEQIAIPGTMACHKATMHLLLTCQCSKGASTRKEGTIARRKNHLK